MTLLLLVNLGLAGGSAAAVVASWNPVARPGDQYTTQIGRSVTTAGE